mgnify:CR=1 FL=1|jgi:hypothetical protein
MVQYLDSILFASLPAALVMLGIQFVLLLKAKVPTKYIVLSIPIAYVLTVLLGMLIWRFTGVSMFVFHPGQAPAMMFHGFTLNFAFWPMMVAGLTSAIITSAVTIQMVRKNA